MQSLAGSLRTAASVVVGLVVLFASHAASQGGEEFPPTGGELLISVRGAESRTQCLFRLVERDSGAPLWEVRGPRARMTWPGKPCMLIVASPRYELVVRELLTPEPVVVELEPAKGTGTLRLVAPAGAPGPEVKLESWVVWEHPCPGPKARNVSMQIHHSLSGEDLVVPIPRGAIFRYMATAENAIVTPLVCHVRAGDPLSEIHVLTRDAVTIAMPEAHAALQPKLLVGSIAYNRPPGLAREHLPAVVDWYNRECCYEYVPMPGSLTVRGIAPVPTHLFVGRLPAPLMHVLVEPPGVPTPPIYQQAAELPAYPQVDGAPAPAGSRVFAGRLDLRTLAMLARSDAEGVIWPRLRGSEQRVPIGYTNSSSYTVLLPDAEIAYGDWTSPHPAQATRAAGALAVLRDGKPCQDRIRLVPVMMGSPIEEMDSEELLHFDLGKREAGRLIGLPEGDYYVTVVPAPSIEGVPDSGDLRAGGIRVAIREQDAMPATSDVASTQK